MRERDHMGVNAALALQFSLAMTMTSRPVLNPFLAFTEGEEFLRDQLQGLPHEALATIVSWYNLPLKVDVATSSAAVIAEDIVRALCDARRPQRGQAHLRAS